MTLFLDTKKRIKEPLLSQLLEISSVVFVDKEQTRAMPTHANGYDIGQQSRPGLFLSTHDQQKFKFIIDLGMRV